ncbi:hypothetical protein [Methanopyrus kandleri]
MSDDKRSYARPLGRTAMFVVASGGYYQLYWFYRNWKDFKEYLGRDVNVVLRTIGLFVPFVNLYLVWKQFVEINELLEEAGLDPCPTKILYPVWFGFFFAGNRGIFHAETRVDALGAIVALMVSCVPLLVVQKKLNEYWREVQGDLPPRGVSKGELTVVAVSCLLIWGGLLIWE